MPIPRITVGVPLYKGADLVAKALDCLQRQTFGNFEVIISVDGNDAESAAACRPYLSDPRFRMVVHSERLDWVGNFNWLLQQDLKEFFCYRQHDDTTAPEFFETLLNVADKEPCAAAIYCDCQMTGGRNDIEVVPAIKGGPLDRMFQYIARSPNLGPPVPARGLIRAVAIRQAGLVRSDEFRAAYQIFGWLANLLRWGNFYRVPQPLYYRLDHARSYTREFWDVSHQAAWMTLFTGLLDAAMRLCRSREERLFFQVLIVNQIITHPPVQRKGEPSSSEELIARFLERLKCEDNAHLIDATELPFVLEELRRQTEANKWSTTSRFQRGLYQIRERYRLGKYFYPSSPFRRIAYQIPQLVEMSRRICELGSRKMRRLLLWE